MIELRFKPVPIFGSVGQYHAYIVTTDTDGTKTFFRGGPDGSPRISSPWFGSITTDHKPYVAGTRDWQEGNPPHIVVLDNTKGCDCYDKNVANILDRIRNADIPYFPESQNSNSVAGTALRDSGITVGPLPVNAPGFGNNLRY